MGDSRPSAKIIEYAEIARETAAVEMATQQWKREHSTRAQKEITRARGRERERA